MQPQDVGIALPEGRGAGRRRFPIPSPPSLAATKSPHLFPYSVWSPFSPERLPLPEGRGGGGWNSLPAELIKEVSDRLPADADQIHIRQVCSHWRASTAPLAACRPWIVAGHGRHRDPFSTVNPIGDHSFWLPRGGRRVPPRSQAPAGVPYCCGTPGGWLALTDDLRSPTRLILWNPLSGAEIPLPTLTTVAQVFLSGDPLTSTSRSWMAIASQKIPNAQLGQRLFFWRPGDAAWTAQLEYPNGRIEGAAFHHCRLYVSTMNMSLDIFDLQQHPPKRLRWIDLHPPLQARYRRARLPGRPAPHVVACNDQMLLVMVYRGLYNAVVLAEVYSPDWTAQRLDLRDKVTDLGDYSLFLGRGDTLALSAKEFPAIRRNCVYFVDHDTAKHHQWLVVFDLGSNALERIPHPQERREGGSKTSGWLGYSWFCPRRPFLQYQE